MIQLSILGVTHLSDFYPNVKYKVELIGRLETVATRILIHDLGPGGLYKNLGKSGLLKKISGYLSLGWGTLAIFVRFLLHKTTHAYVVYPAPALIFLLSLLPKSMRPVIYMDAFISIYDTAVNDRAMLVSGAWLARLLFWLERRAFLTSDYVFVDTLENARYYAEIFGVRADRFHVIPLSIPPLALAKNTRKAADGKFTCLFVGSLVPLHGIASILAAAKQLAHIPDLEFVVIGDGQEAFRIEAFLQDAQRSNLRWYRGMYPTEFIENAIADADLCLGIFGETRKTGRVLPYKIYYYAALAKPFLTLRTPCLETYCAGTGDYFLCDAAADSPASLAARISCCHADRDFLRRAAAESALLYAEQLSSQVIKHRLFEYFKAGA